MRFDEYIIIDWSAANSPQTGSNSIWICSQRRLATKRKSHQLQNIATRLEAIDWLKHHLCASIQLSQKILVGFDFPFGFPAGTASALGMQGSKWQSIWKFLFDGFVDNHKNQNNRFDLAEDFNQRLTGEAFPFWGNVRDEKRKYLVRRGRRPHMQNDVAEKRLVEKYVPKAQPVWKLAGIGSAGSQALTGIPAVWSLRYDPQLAKKTRIWPFETGLCFDPSAQVIIAEIYPSIFPFCPIKGRPKDAAQVLAAAQAFSVADQNNRLVNFFTGRPSLSEKDKLIIESEEAWILGVI